eukprot:CCRYP_010387-RA/>CCRYP_010387-RA protein AED:0.10 eAED:0.10 QI:0/-1/0/1/-1/1/1/0/655
MDNVRFSRSTAPTLCQQPSSSPSLDNKQPKTAPQPTANILLQTMEFLAESIGLLDLDTESRAYVAPAPAAETAIVRSSTNSKSLFRWWDDDGDHIDGGGVEEGEPVARQQPLDIAHDDETTFLQKRHAVPSLEDEDEEDELEQFLFGGGNSNNAMKQDHVSPESNNSSLHSISSLSPDSPLTLSASSSLNFSRCSLLQGDIPKKSRLRLWEESDAQQTHIVGLAPRLKTASSSPPPTSPAADNIITKHVTHRLHSNSSFTGNIDALTGQPLHGTLISQSGSVYQGPFATHHGQAVRHGHGECSYANGMKFVGRYEWDSPVVGVWFGDGWVYEGECIKMDENTREGVSGGIHRVIGVSSPLPDAVLFHGTGRFMRANGHVYQGEFMWGLAQGVGKEILPYGRGVYYGEFWDGLRHGVGTLMEYYWDNDAEEEDECSQADKCDNHLVVDGSSEEVGDQVGSRTCCDQGVSPLSQETQSHSRVDLDDDTRSTGNKSSSTSNNNGPDFAAGGSSSSSIIADDHPPLNRDRTASSITTSMNENTSSLEALPLSSTTSPIISLKRSDRTKTQHHRNNTTKQRFSSGVWIAGQYEIEDSRGVLHPGSNQVVEEEVSSTPGSELNQNNDSINDLKEENERGTSFSSLNRTTWDLLPEKWLGLG